MPWKDADSMKRKRNLKVLCLVVIVMVIAAVPALAGMAISARYLQPRGNQIKWVISIPNPAPSAVIVTQYIRPGSDILASSHSVGSYDREKGIVKWLLTSVEPGTLQMEMEISLPIRRKGEIHGEVLFKGEFANTTASMFMDFRPRKKAVEGC